MCAACLYTTRESHSLTNSAYACARLGRQRCASDIQCWGYKLQCWSAASSHPPLITATQVRSGRQGAAGLICTFVCLIITTVLRELMVSMWLKKRHKMLQLPPASRDR